MVSDGTGKKGLPSSRRTVKEDTLRLSDTKGLEEFRMLYWQLDDLLYFLYLLVQTTDHLIGAIGNLFDHHERDEWVNFVWKDFVNCVGI